MFIRRKRSVQKSGEYEYLQIVESIRDGDKVRQKVIGTLAAEQTRFWLRERSVHSFGVLLNLHTISKL